MYRARMIIETSATTYYVSLLGSSKQNNIAAKPAPAAIVAETLSGHLIALCTSDLNDFLKIKNKLATFPVNEVCAEASRLLAKNSRSLRLLSFVSHPDFFSEWECIESKHQVTLYGGLASHSLNKSMKEAAFHLVAKALRKDCLAHQSVSKPTKLRLRDCHALIGQFMYDYALLSETNRCVVLKALAEGEETGCGHLPSQQGVALIKRLSRLSVSNGSI